MDLSFICFLFVVLAGYGYAATKYEIKLKKQAKRVNTAFDDEEEAQSLDISRLSKSEIKQGVNYDNRSN